MRDALNRFLYSSTVPPGFRASSPRSSRATARPMTRRLPTHAEAAFDVNRRSRRVRGRRRHTATAVARRPAHRGDPARRVRPRGRRPATRASRRTSTSRTARGARRRCSPIDAIARRGPPRPHPTEHRVAGDDDRDDAYDPKERPRKAQQTSRYAADLGARRRARPPLCGARIRSGSCSRRIAVVVFFRGKSHVMRPDGGVKLDRAVLATTTYADMDGPAVAPARAVAEVIVDAAPIDAPVPIDAPLAIRHDAHVATTVVDAALTVHPAGKGNAQDRRRPVGRGHRRWRQARQDHCRSTSRAPLGAT